MRVRDLALKLGDQPGATLARRIAIAIETAIRDGRLKAGIALPGSRALAEELGVNRNTVIAALHDLEAEGWIESEANRGTFVSADPPVDGQVASSPVASRGLGFDLPSRLVPITAAVPGALNLSEGAPDSRIAPTEEMAKAYQRALRRHGQELLQHGEPHGNLLLRQALADWSSERYGVTVSPDQILVTSGGRMALQLICMALLRPGDMVGVEQPGSRRAWETFRKTSQATLVPLAVDDQGLSTTSLETALKDHLLRMVYVTPRSQNPTGVILSPARAQHLLELAARYRVAVFEDDHDGETTYSDTRTLPLFAQDTTGQVIFASSFARVVASGLRVGFLIVPQALVAPLARLRRDQELQGDRVLEWSVADLIRDGEISRHIRRVKRIYEQRRDTLVSLLRESLGSDLAFTVPDCGTSLWVRVREGLDAKAWIEAARSQGLVLDTPERYFLAEPTACFRMAFSQVDETELGEAVRRLSLARPSS